MVSHETISLFLQLNGDAEKVTTNGDAKKETSEDQVEDKKDDTEEETKEETTEDPAVSKKNMAIFTSALMCDFHNFGLIFMGQCSLPQRLKSTFFEKISTRRSHRSEETISKNVDFSL